MRMVFGGCICSMEGLRLGLALVGGGCAYRANMGLVLFDVEVVCISWV